MSSLSRIVTQGICRCSYNVMRVQHPCIQRIIRKLSFVSTSELRLHEALCDAHDPDGVALRYQTEESKVRELTYQELSERSSQLANVLREEGNVRAGDVVAVMLPKGPAVMEVAVALARLGSVYQPLFTAFQPEGIRARIGPSGAVAVITDASNRSKFRELLDDDKKVFCVGAQEAGLEDARDYDECISKATPLQVGHHQSPKIGSNVDHPMALLYSSGTTGPPKGIICNVKALENFRMYLEQGIGLRSNNQDKYWNIADSGWAYGLYYNVYGPLYVAQTAHMLVTPFSPQSTLQFLATHQISSFTAAPTVYRALRSLPDDVIHKYRNHIVLAAASSAGESLPPSVSEWFQQSFGVSILNHYGQTENGMMVNQHREGPRRWSGTDPSSIGTPMEGFDGAYILNDQGEVIEDVGVEGELCMKLSECSRFWFSGYFGRDTPVADERGFYHTGDRASILEIMNGEKVFAFSSRGDDIINTAGYRCGPTEIENSIMQLDFVSEVGVVGFPDDRKGEVIEAFVVVNNQVGELDLAIAEDKIMHHVKTNLASHLAPKIIKFVPSLPRTESGKLKRFVLRKESYE